MFAFNRCLRHIVFIKSLRLNSNQQICQSIQYISVNKRLQHNFREKTEKFSFNTVQNTGADADTFGTLSNNVDINDKLDILPPEADDKIEYDKDEQNKRLYITEYHKIIKELIKKHKV